MINVKFKKINESAVIPVKSTPGSSGYDLFAISETVLQPVKVNW